jgi:hypothetical protein
MKKNTILTGVLAMAALCGGSAMAQNFNNGDLIIALGNNTPGGNANDNLHNDLLVDLGSISQFQFYTAASQDQTYTYNLSAALTAAFGSGTVGSSIYWAVLGVNDPGAAGYQTSVNQGAPNTVWASLARSNPSVKTTTPYVSGNNDAQALAVGDIETIINLNSPGQASPGLITSLATINGGSASAVNASLGSFTETIGSDGNLGGDWSKNVLNNGVGTSDLYQSNTGNPIRDRQVYLGSISLSSAGVLTITTVPEPSTLAMVAGGFLSLFAIRRFKNRNA